MRTEKATAPSYWASYLINSDASGMDQEELSAANAWIDSLGWGMPVTCEDYGFRWHHDASEFMPLGADCQEYTFLVESV